MINEIPVLIVGGGAAGVILTAELRRRGIGCRTIDKLPIAHSYSKALTVHARTLEIFERLDEDLLNKFLQRGHPVKGFTFTFKGIDKRPALDFQSLDTSYPYVLNHRQDETERFVREYIKDEFDYEVEWNTELVEIEHDDEGITAKLVHKDDNDREEFVHARWLIACDGMNSRIRQTLGLDYEGDSYTGMVLQNMDVSLDGFPEERNDWLNFFMTRDHFILITPIPGGHYRLLLSDMGDAADPSFTPKQAFQMFVDEHLNDVTMGEPIWASKWEIWNRLASTYRKGNIFLVGDSAHVHSPSGGQGMNCCMQDANNLAWKLALVVEGRAKPELLDSYEVERKPIAEQVIEGASAIHQIIMGHGVDVENRFELADDQKWLDAAVGRLSGISYSYHDYVETPEQASEIEGPRIGDRAPDVKINDHLNLFSLFRHPDMTLLLLPHSYSGAETENCRTLITTLGNTYGSLIRSYILTRDKLIGSEDIIADTSGAMAKNYGRSETGRLYLIRPDGYIGFRCLLSEIELFHEYLESIFIPKQR